MPDTKRYKYHLHGGRIVGRVLKEHGVRHVFGIPGGHVWALDSGFHEHGVRRVHMRLQQSAAYAAEAYARCSASPGICYGTAGIGPTESVSGINQAWLNHSPVIGLFGMHSWDGNRRGALQEVYPSRLYESITKWSMDIDEPPLISLYLPRAFRDCLTYPRGPIVLGLTTYALGPVISFKYKYLLNQDFSRHEAPSAAQGDPAAVERAVKLLLQAERPVVIAGEGIHWCDAAAELKELVELLNIPVHTRRVARGAVPEDHPLSFSAGYRLRFWQEADVVLVVGLKLGWFEYYGASPAWPTGAKQIIVDQAVADIGASMPAEEFIVGNLKSVLRQMVDCAASLVKSPPPREKWLDYLRLCRGQFEEELARGEEKYQSRKPIHPWVLAREIATSLDSSTTIVFDSFVGSASLSERVKASFSGQILDSGEAANFGHGIGMGIGAQLARPGKPVFVLMGDAGIGIAGGDIETAVRYNLPIVYVVCNMGSWWGGIHLWFEGQTDSPQLLPGLRYDKMYEAIGCHAEYVTQPEEIRPSLERAFNSGKTSVVNVIVDGNIIHPWFEATAVRIGIISHQLDLNKVREPLRTYIIKGRIPEIEEELESLGIPPASRGELRTHDLAKCW